MAVTKKKAHSSKRYARRGDKPVQVWFNRTEMEGILRVAQASFSSVTALCKRAVLRRVAELLKKLEEEPDLPLD